MEQKTYFSRDLRGFLTNITPLTYFIRKAIYDQVRPFTHFEKIAMLSLIDIIELRMGDMKYDIHYFDKRNEEVLLQKARMRDYLHGSAKGVQERRRRLPDRDKSTAEDVQQEPLQTRFQGM